MNFWYDRMEWKEHSQMNKKIITRKTCFKKLINFKILGESVQMYWVLEVRRRRLFLWLSCFLLFYHCGNSTHPSEPLTLISTFTLLDHLSLIHVPGRLSTTFLITHSVHLFSITLGQRSCSILIFVLSAYVNDWASQVLRLCISA